MVLEDLENLEIEVILQGKFVKIFLFFSALNGAFVLSPFFEKKRVDKSLSL